MKRSERTDAIQLRRDGATYETIQRRLGVAKSTVWRWCRAEGLVEQELQRLTELKRFAQRKGAAAVQAKYLAATRYVMQQAEQSVGRLSRRDLWLIGAALYWAEGTKQKPHNISQRVTFTNSDPAMLHLFLAWLRDICQISEERLVFELVIHESGNAESAKLFWSSTLRIPVTRFQVRLKRHALSLRRRRNTAGYAGLIRIIVRQSAQLNRQIAGWVQGIGESANGKPSDFGSEYPGSIPGSPAIVCPDNGESFEVRDEQAEGVRRRVAEYGAMTYT